MVKFSLRANSSLSLKNIYMSKSFSALTRQLFCFLLLTISVSVQPVQAKEGDKPVSKEQMKQLVKETNNTISFIENKGTVGQRCKSGW
jgi:hypothetical protein